VKKVKSLKIFLKVDRPGLLYHVYGAFLGLFSLFCVEEFLWNVFKLFTLPGFFISSHPRTMHCLLFEPTKTVLSFSIPDFNFDLTNLDFWRTVSTSKSGLNYIILDVYINTRINMGLKNAYYTKMLVDWKHHAAGLYGTQIWSTKLIRVLHATSI
jgi:hypothetical protein